METKISDSMAARTLHWIHADCPAAQREPLIEDVLNKLSLAPLDWQTHLRPQLREADGALVAGCYFKLLSGQVATLGGVRAAQGWEEQAVGLLTQQLNALQAARVPQIQAIVHSDQWQTSELVRQAGMVQLTRVTHQWLALEQLTRQPPEPDIASLQWRPACELSHEQLAELIDQTFEHTLDCPAINGLRSSQQVLEGFLEDRTLAELGHAWQIVEVQGELVGCLLLQTHLPSLLEIVYLGLLPAARGKSWGQQLVQRALRYAAEHGLHSVAAAVDEQNWPALELYRRFGFRPQQSFEVWLHRRAANG